MFRKFSKADNIKTTSPVRSSEQRAIRAQILQQYPALEEYVEDIFPKKESLIMCKCKDYIQMVTDPSGELIFFQCRSGPFIPTLRFLHKCARQTPHTLPGP
jgi:PUA domain protein